MKQKNMTLDTFEKFFLQKKESILNPVNSNKEIEVDGGDEIDIVQSLVLNEMAERLSQRERNTLTKINGALQRIKDGTFGICEECEEDIGEKRLMAVPDCSTCIICAERQEKKAKQFRN